MLYLIISILIVLLIKFIIDKNKEVAKIKSEGGMMIKHSKLIRSLSTHPQSIVKQISPYSVKIIVKDKFVITTFTINHGFSDYTVFWDHQSVTFGEHNLNWKFPEYMDQNSALNLISNELVLYEENMIKNYL